MPPLPPSAHSPRSLSVSISASFSFYAWCPPFLPAYSFSCSRSRCWRRWHFIIAASSMESALNYGQQTDWGGSTRLGSVSHDLVGVVRECLQVQAKLSRSGATPPAAAEAAKATAEAEAAAAAAAHVSLVNALRCQLSLNKHSNAPANGRHTWLHFQQKSTPTPDTLTHTHTQSRTHIYEYIHIIIAVNSKRQFCWLNAFERVAQLKTCSSSQSQFQSSISVPVSVTPFLLSLPPSPCLF